MPQWHFIMPALKHFDYQGRQTYDFLAIYGRPIPTEDVDSMSRGVQLMKGKVCGVKLVKGKGCVLS